MQGLTTVTTLQVKQQLHLPFHADFARLVSCVGKLFDVDAIEELETSDAKRKKNKMVVHDTVTLTHTVPPGRVLMEWEASPASDMIADAITSLLMQAEGSIAGIRLGGCCSSGHNHGKAVGGKKAKNEKGSNSGSLILLALLRESFGTEDVEVSLAKKKLSKITVTDPKTEAKVAISFKSADGEWICSLTLFSN